MDTLTIHVGLHRTGTTYLQLRVFPHLEGVTYVPRPHATPWASRVAWEPGSTWDAAARRKEVESWMSGLTILSREGLAGMVFNLNVDQERTAQRLASMFPDARILITIRRQDTYIASLYKLFVMSGGTSSFESFVGYGSGQFVEGYGRVQIARTGRVMLSMFHLDYLANLFESLFPSRVSLVPFEHLLDGAPAFVKAVCGAIGAPLPPHIWLERDNAGYGGRQIAIARRLNRIFRSSVRPDALFKGQLPVIGDVTPRRFLQTPPSQRWLGNTPVVDKTLATKILAHYAESNRRLDERYQLGLSKWGYY